MTFIYLLELSHLLLLLFRLHFFRPLLATFINTLLFYYFLADWLLYSFFEYVGIDFFRSFLLLLLFAGNYAPKKLEAIDLCLFFVSTMQVDK